MAAFVAIFAVAIFGIPVGILGDGFGDAISDQMETVAELRRRRADLKASFERADSDSSGKISPEELYDAIAVRDCDPRHGTPLVHPPKRHSTVLTFPSLSSRDSPL